jgi:hypothetical protein
MKAVYILMAISSMLGREARGQQSEEKFQYVTVEGGVTIPVGKLKNTMNIAPNIGFWVRKPYTESSILAVGASVNFPKSTTIHYRNDDFQTETKSLSGIIGFRFDQNYSLHRAKQIDIGWSSIAGYGFYFFDDVRARAEYESLPPSKKDKDEKPIFIRPFSTVHIGQGIQLRIRDFGIQARYNYAPYALFSDIIDDRFGAHSISVGLFYRQ